MWTMTMSLSGLTFKVPETMTWYFIDGLLNLPSMLFMVLLRLLMCWMSWRQFFSYYLMSLCACFSTSSETFLYFHYVVFL